MSVAIIAALPREISGLVHGLKADDAFKRKGILLYRRGDAVLVAGGMGADRATLSILAALASSQVHTLVSTGLAGSCQASVLAGQVLRASVVIDTKSGERFQTSDSTASAVLVSAPQIASVNEKRRLHVAYGASMVDMEAVTVARLATANGLGFKAVKGISEAHDVEIGSLAEFSGPEGQFETARFAIHTALRPHTWRRAVTLGRNSKAALDLLSETLLPLINTK